MSPFYRFVRPVRFSERRLELETLPRGGACVRFVAVGDQLRFTYAVCAPTDRFSREVARRVADARAASFTFEGPPVGATDLLSEVVQRCATWRPVDPQPADVYRTCGLRAFGRALEALLSANALERRRAALWREGLGAMRLAERYGAHGASSAQDESDSTET